MGNEHARVDRVYCKEKVEIETFQAKRYHKIFQVYRTVVVQFHGISELWFITTYNSICISSVYSSNAELNAYLQWRSST
jgi:hypothetical protein